MGCSADHACHVLHEACTVPHPTHVLAPPYIWQCVIPEPQQSVVCTLVVCSLWCLLHPPTRGRTCAAVLLALPQTHLC